MWRPSTLSWASLEMRNIGNEVEGHVHYETREEAELRGVDSQPENPGSIGFVTTDLLKIKGKIAGFPSYYNLKSSGAGKFHILISGGEKLSFLQDYDFTSCAVRDVIEEGETPYLMKLASISVFDRKTEACEDEYALYIALRATAPEKGPFEHIGHLGPAGNRNDCFDGDTFEKSAESRTITIQ